jgi:hypothetical protein
MITREDIEAFAEDNSYWSEPPKSYPTPLEMIKHYQKVAGQGVKPQVYLNLIDEELKEWLIECYYNGSQDPAAELKELADLLYVLYGYANVRGWDLDEALYRVHSNNLGRMYQPDGSIKRRKDGKIEKNKDYPKVDLGDLV